MSFQSVHDLLTPPTIVRKQKFWDWFSGSQLKSWWNFTDISGTGSSGMADAVDDGFQITCGSSNGNASAIDFNDIRHYTHDSSVTEFVIRLITTGSVNHIVGLVSTKAWSSDHFSAIQCSANVYRLVTKDGSTFTAISTGVSLDTNSHKLKVVQQSSSILGYVDDVLSALATADLPSTNMQPAFRVGTSEAVAKTAHISRFEAYNT